MQPTEQAELVPAFLIPIQMRMHMHVLVKFVLPRSRHVCRHTQKGRERERHGHHAVDSTHAPIPLHSKETMLLYLWTLYMGYNRVV